MTYMSTLSGEFFCQESREALWVSVFGLLSLLLGSCTLYLRLGQHPVEASLFRLCKEQGEFFFNHSIHS